MNLVFKPNFLAFLFIFIISFFALKDLTKPGFYTSHDGETHTARIAQYYQALKDGQFPPRYAGSFYNNFGSPIFVYIYPLPYLLGAILHFIGPNFTNSFKILMGLGFIFSGIFSYFWLKELFKDKWAALLGALFYMFSPYRLQLIYVRGSISELLAYTFVPLALYLITTFQKKITFRNVSLCTLSIAAILLSQNLVAFLTLPLIILYAVYLSVSTNNFKIMKITLISSIWAIAIAAFTYLPALLEREYIKFDEVFKLVYGSHFVTFKQLIRSPWGYGFDLPGTVNDQMSFQIGLAHLLVISLTLMILCLIMLKNTFRTKNLHIRLIVGCYFLILIFIFLTLDNSITKKVWDNFELLQIIDIPWRILGLMPLMVAILSAFLLKRIPSGGLLLFLMVVLVYANRNHVRINESLLFDDEHFLNYKGTATQLSEFTPSERRSVSIPNFTDTKLLINTAGGWATYSSLKTSSKKISFNVTVLSDNAVIRINRFYFPGVKAYAYTNGVKSKKPLYPSPTGNIRLDSKKETHGFIFLPIVKGSYQIVIIFGETFIRYLSNFITLSALLLAFYIFKKNET